MMAASAGCSRPSTYLMHMCREHLSVWRVLLSSSPAVRHPSAPTGTDHDSKRSTSAGFLPTVRRQESRFPPLSLLAGLHSAHLADQSHDNFLGIMACRAHGVVGVNSVCFCRWCATNCEFHVCGSAALCVGGPHPLLPIIMNLCCWSQSAVGPWE